jgi:hypothetical protein
VDQIPTPATVGELSILVMTKLDSIEKQLDGLPAKVQELQFEVKTIKQRSVDRRQLVMTWIGIAAGFAAGVAGVVIK